MKGGEFEPFSALTVTVPGAAAAWEDTVKMYGKLSLKEVKASWIFGRHSHMLCLAAGADTFEQSGKLKRLGICLSLPIILLSESDALAYSDRQQQQQQQLV